MTISSAMIFAAGFGTRMGLLTRHTPKPLLPIHDRPMIDHTIALLKDAGVKTLVANTHYLADQVEAHLADQSIITLREDPILETGGGLKAALPLLGNAPVITMNPDVMWHGPNPVSALIAAWKPEMSGLLMLARTDRSDSDFSLESGEIRRCGPYRYTGIQIVRTDRLNEIQKKTFSLNVYWDLLLRTGPLHGVIYEGDWTDIGTEQALIAANEVAREG